ncbi:Exodeoxyribonuclease VII large subunit [Fontimonas thermophila]|uniref:Exodeoxyribonuclease 7 large subunit n=1 Tax=Fontimonas thermophila TaxID=1076937 RepID=A0A1I2JP46_9GAMM|nr:exodeoxyribonuclease VII large subunit [Fontimonas thermophila]SFF55690.1 Exodeoxyribonuclease VII large subunit [Fontimonas thermophila]
MSAPGRTIYTVSELADILRALIEDALPRVWVQGEISNFSRPSSGHWYFTLKDAQAQLRCAMFRNANFHIRPQPKDGDEVLVRAQVSFYSPRGDLQLICEHLEPAGEGALLRAFEALKKRLAAEGLFDEAHKRALPRLPRAIGVITSASGAAIQDILTTLARRYPLAPVWLYPVPVQGASAPPAIVHALRELPQRAPVDVVILARGGGSLEDLWAFNDEAVARAIRACAVPVICGIGHEVDVTIADFAADLRAPTPTAAAERVAPDIADLDTGIRQQQARLHHAIERRMETQIRRLDSLDARLQAQHPARRMQDRAQRLDELHGRIIQSMTTRIAALRQGLHRLAAQLQARAPATQIVLRQRRLDTAQARLHGALRRHLANADLRCQRAASVLASLDPRAVLARGYAIALDAQGHVLSDAAQARIGDALRLILARGELDARIEQRRSDH